MSVAPFFLTKRKTFTVKRFPPRTYVEGMLVEGTPTTLQVVGNIQPPTASELTWLEKQDPIEAGQTREIFKLYCDTELRTLDESLNIMADVVEYKNKEYEVQRVWPYEMGVLDHFKVLIVRKPDQ